MLYFNVFHDRIILKYVIKTFHNTYSCAFGGKSQIQHGILGFVPNCKDSNCEVWLIFLENYKMFGSRIGLVIQVYIQSYL
jgi:hypothetical protein